MIYDATGKPLRARRSIGYLATLTMEPETQQAGSLKDAIATKTVARPTRWVFRHQLPAPVIGRQR